MFPKAYQTSDDNLHYVCAWCPDAEEASRELKRIEWNKEIERLIEGYSDYKRKEISHTICEPCKEKQLSALRGLS